MYANRIDIARKLVALLFGVFGLGFALALNLRHQIGAAVLGVGALACLVAVLGLVVEYLVRSWIETRRNGTAACQFTLVEMLGVTAALALVLCCYRLIGGATIALLIAAGIIVACTVEFIRRKNADVKALGLSRPQLGHDDELAQH